MPKIEPLEPEERMPQVEPIAQKLRTRMEMGSLRLDIGQGKYRLARNVFQPGL